jgi:hypothetical protein
MVNTMRILFHAPGLAVFRPITKLPHILGVQPTATDRLDTLLPSHKLTGNRGNIIHAEAPAKIFAKSPYESAYGNIAMLQKSLGARFPDVMAAHYDLIIISMANFIRPNHDGSALVKALRGLNDRVPYIVLGCGLQGSHRLSDMMPGNRDLIAHFNENALVFGVRGTKTANWLADNGFGNSSVLGCPSLYAYPNSILKIDGTSARQRGAEANVMTAGHLSMHRGRIVPRGRELATAFEHVKASYVFQDEFFAYGDLPKTPGLYQEGASEVAHEPVNSWLSMQLGQKVDFERYYYFNEASAWRQASLRHDVFIGDRFHGGVAALQAGLPAIFLTHDNRVSELTEHVGLPNLITEEFARRGLADTLNEFLSPEKLSSMKALYKTRYAEFFKVMAPFGLKAAVTLDAVDTSSTASDNRTVTSVVQKRAAPVTPKSEVVQIISQGAYTLRLIQPKYATDLVITFEAADQTINRKDQQRKGFGEAFLLKNGYAVLSVLTSSANWFRPPAIVEAFERPDVKDFLSRFDKRHSYGSSMGGFGALVFADLLGVSNVVVMQPISSLASDLTPWETRFAHGRALNWSGNYRDGCDGITRPASIYTLFDPATLDAKHVFRLAEAAGSRLHKISVPEANHAVPRLLLRKGILESTILACLRATKKADVQTIISSH